MSNELSRILIVDDEAPLVRALGAALELDGYRVDLHTSAPMALEAIALNSHDLLITDLNMPGLDGMSLLRAAWERDPDIAGIVITGHGTIDVAVQALQLGALDFLQKPFNLNVVRSVVSRALKSRKLRMENSWLLAQERQYVRELEEAYQTLDAFSASISHDLRAPLRAIVGFTTTCLADHGASLPTAARRQLDVVVSSASRMNEMIEDLLRFCRCTRQSLRKRHVDTRALVEMVVRELNQRFAPHAPRIDIGDLPDCHADCSLLEQVFVNLLSNAYKFTRTANSPRIEITASDETDCLTFCVRDNGAGFDMSQSGKLFDVFSRLHSNSEYEGTGVGLSIVRRIIERHGGRIWAEGAPGCGAVFYFTLPTPALESTPAQSVARDGA